MTKQRLEAFSDAVIAIIITIMVLGLEVPHSTEWSALRPLAPPFFTHVLSFIFLGIYWSNHHHMLHAVSRINGKILWANLHLLFWLSLIPFVTGWMGENNFEPVPTATYGFVLLFAGIAYYILEQLLIAHEGKDSKLKAAVGKEIKGIVSVVFYLLAIPLAFIDCWISLGLFVLVALMWLVPDRRIERKL
ncbi:MAG: TMEM175 family protein [Candidatus Zixiibacteriota bacterium]